MYCVVKEFQWLRVTVVEVLHSMKHAGSVPHGEHVVIAGILFDQRKAVIIVTEYSLECSNTAG